MDRYLWPEEIAAIQNLFTNRYLWPEEIATVQNLFINRYLWPEEIVTPQNLFMDPTGSLSLARRNSNDLCLDGHQCSG